jgi:hypothetical protein
MPGSEKRPPFAVEFFQLYSRFMERFGRGPACPHGALFCIDALIAFLAACRAAAAFLVLSFVNEQHT